MKACKSVLMGFCSLCVDESDRVNTASTEVDYKYTAITDQKLKHRAKYCTAIEYNEAKMIKLAGGGDVAELRDTTATHF